MRDDVVEERLRAAFGEVAEEQVRPHPGAYAENRRRLRRARTRRRAAVPIMAAAAAAAVAVPFLVADATRDAEDRDTASPLAPRVLDDPAKLVDPASLVRISGVPGFRVDALGSDGSVLGRTPDAKVWRAGPTTRTPVATGVRAQGGLSTGSGAFTWIKPGGFDLECRDATGKTRVVSPQSAEAKRPVWADGGFLAWSDIMRQPFTAEGCRRPGKAVPNHGKAVLGDAVAFSAPDLWVVEPSNDKVLRQVDVRTGRIVKETPLPAGVRGQTMADTDQTWYAAANKHVFAWVAGGTLRTADRSGRAQDAVPLPRWLHPGAKGAQATMTAGNRHVAYSVTGADGHRQAVLFDPLADRAVSWRGVIHVAGDWLLWSDGRDYRMGRVLPTRPVGVTTP
ncbi:hypothetical protein SMC26_34765 [Actinomadura fulvescens]|uniref:WD40 repeat domain-containing protein n=1 Tax=Actinomadura fulvescens TaxID=46160 RepID=A0ABN3PFP7_9ACTN